METIIWSHSLFTDSMNFQHIVKHGGALYPLKKALALFSLEKLLHSTM